jgi:flagellar hook-associated protein 2
MRVTGLTSGLDTESIISALVSAYDLKTQKYTKAQTKLSWTQDAWKSLNTKVYSLYTNVSNLRFSSAYATKKTTVSDATKASVTASGSAVNGTQTLEINSIAQSGYMTGGKITPVSDSSRDATDTKLSELGFTGNDTSFNVTLGDGTTKSIKVTGNTKISDITSELTSLGLNANFDTNQNRFYISSKTTGEAADFTISAKAASKDENGNALTYDRDSYDALYALGFATKDTQSKVEPGVASSDVNVSMTGTAADGSAVATSMTVSFASPKSADEATAQNRLVTQLKLGNITSEKETDDEGNEQVVYKVGENYTIKDGKVYKNDDLENAIATVDGLDLDATQVAGVTWEKATATGGSNASYSAYDASTDSTRYATKIDGADAEIILNDVKYTSTSNSFSINGLSINALAKTDNGPITITTATDTQAIYDKVKDFLTEYNTIINEMTKLYNADSSYGYDPLTDDEKDAMSDTEIEKWETKIKDSLLRNDTTLNGVMMSMINAMSSSYEVDGKKYTLSSFGIATLGYLNAAENENYAYHIDGDSDDENTSSNTDKLMAAITEDPDTVISFMKQLTSGLYTAIGNKMKSTTLSSAYTIYNDKEMNSQYSEYSTTISKWEDKLADKEDYYYSKFASMESALTKLQSSTSALTGMTS